MTVRPAEETELDQLATIWDDAWQDAHRDIVPAALIRARTLAGFRARLGDALPGIRVVGQAGAPVGFCIIQHDELYQLFVSAAARGSGVAKALLDDAEMRLAGAGITTAWLACAIGNDRAARFYEKSGWHRAGTIVSHLETIEGTIPLEVWRYEKELRP
jgi:ribosomal protein S18 acetylase RimI-like enzyme